MLLALLSTAVATNELYNAFVTTKALCFRASVILALPFYIYLLLSLPKLRPNPKNPLTLAVTTFLLLCLVAALFGVNPGRSFWGTYERMGGVYHLAHLTLLYFYLLMLSAANHRYLRVTLQLLVWLAAISGLYGLGQLLEKEMRTTTVFTHRASSVYGSPIFFASFLILPMALALFFAGEARTRILRNLYVGLFAAQLLGLLSSGTRGAFLSLLVSVAIAAVLIWPNMREVIRRPLISPVLGIGAVSVTLLILAAVQMSPDNPFRRLVNFSDPTRLIEWREAWEGFRERPVRGVGPENYYVIDNEHFDRELYKYGGAAFDKPHNYALEILATTGIGGFLAYTSIVVLTAIAFCRAPRICWLQCVVLLCGAASYYLQNLFAFDTPASGITFYIYTGLAASLWKQNDQPALDSKHARCALPPIGKAVVCTVGLASICLMLLTDVGTAVTLRDLQHGILVGIGDVRLAKSYFDNAVRSRFVVDRVELGCRYHHFAVQLIEEAPERMEAGFVDRTLEAASVALEQASGKDGNDPAVWLALGHLYLLKAMHNMTPVDPRGYAAIRQAMLLEPHRVEPLYLLARCYAIDHQPKHAIATAESVVQILPDNPTAQWELSEVYWTLHQDDLAARSEENAIRLGYRFVFIRQLLSLANYYLDQQNFDRAADLYKIGLKLRPNDFQLYASLAATYARSGFKQGARDAARKAAELNPTLEAAMRKFLRTLD